MGRKSSNDNYENSDVNAASSKRKSKGKDDINDIMNELNKKKMNEKKNMKDKKDGNFSGNMIGGMYKNKLRYILDNIIIISIILSFVILISFKYLEEKYSIESYFEEGDSFDYYEILKCKRGDSIQKIKKNYRDLSKQYHPDSNKNCNDCDKKFQEITKAYKTLSDSRLKKAYDNSKGKVLKLIESNSINLNMKNYVDLVENSNDYWIIQIYSDTDSLCLSFSNIWEESFDKYHEYISFGRINISTDKKLIKQKVPFNVKIYPTIFILSPDGTYQLYSNIFNATSKDFQNFITSNYPNNIYDLKMLNDALYKMSALNIKKSGYIDKNHHVILLTNKKKLSLQAKQITYKFNNIYKTYSIKYNEIDNISNESIKKSIIDSLKVLSIKKDEYLKENQNIDYFILVNNNQVKIIRRISPTNIKNVYNDALKKNIVEINSINVDSVCSTIGSRKTYCYVIFVDNIDDEKNVNYMRKTYQNINSSYNKFVSKNGSEETEEQLFIQPVYVLKKNLTKKFNKFINDKTINKYDTFLLDYSSNTFSSINEIKNLSNYSQNKEDLSFLHNIYKDIEILSFQKIPKYCLPFNINCLFNIKTTTPYKLYNIINRTSKLQIIFSLIVAFMLFPTFKEYGFLKYVFFALSVSFSVIVINIKDFILLLAS
ncbi:DnaJ protein, putative [Plasmodium sp. DRC-Itaito]|nr:DnaJ protein, putative [Plasmodium sp. DRC-Itaito]